MSAPLKVGIVGCGVIAGTYLANRARFESFQITACADKLRERAEARATEFDVAKVCSVTELLEDPEIDVVLNLTIPAAHAEVSVSALEAGKHVYSEKPLAATADEGRRILRAAKEAGKRVGSAPDTFLGAGGQTSRHILDGGWIGDPVAAAAVMVHRGPERFHGAPEFFYQPGGGPLFDMGPYFLSTLINLLGPVRRVCASAKSTWSERTITTRARFGETVKVETPTHLAGILDFESGVVATLVTSFDVWWVEGPSIEVFGTEGSLQVPHPNMFGGTVRMRMREEAVHEMPLTYQYAEDSRGIGLADMAEAIAEGRPHRANAEVAFHVLEIMEAYLQSSREGRHVEIRSHCERPQPMEPGLGPAIVPGL